MEYDVIIIGAGPAGLTAGLYAGRYRLRTRILEKLAVGGRILLTDRIDNYPGFPDGITSQELSGRMRAQVEKLEVSIMTEEALEVDCSRRSVRTDSAAYQARALIIATGAYPRRLNVPGEDMFVGRGVSYCATCDAPFFRDKEVVVVGGGNSVAEEALYLARYARKVVLVHRRDELRASAILQEELGREPKIEFLLSSVVTGIRGTQKVSAVGIKDLKSGQESERPCDGVFIFIGYEPDTQMFRNLLRTDEAGFIITDRGMATDKPGVFACGDCCQKSLFQVITASAEGAIAADSAFKFISAAAR